MNRKNYTYPCNNCQRLTGDDLGTSCPKQPEGLPFHDRLIKCKWQIPKGIIILSCELCQNSRNGHSDPDFTLECSNCARIGTYHDGDHDNFKQKKLI